MATSSPRLLSTHGIPPATRNSAGSGSSASGGPGVAAGSRSAPPPLVPRLSRARRDPGRPRRGRREHDRRGPAVRERRDACRSSERHLRADAVTAEFRAPTLDDLPALGAFFAELRDGTALTCLTRRQAPRRPHAHGRERRRELPHRGRGRQRHRLGLRVVAAGSDRSSVHRRPDASAQPCVLRPPARLGRKARAREVGWRRRQRPCAGGRRRWAAGRGAEYARLRARPPLLRDGDRPRRRASRAGLAGRLQPEDLRHGRCARCLRRRHRGVRGPLGSPGRDVRGVARVLPRKLRLRSGALVPRRGRRELAAFSLCSSATSPPATSTSRRTASLAPPRPRRTRCFCTRFASCVAAVARRRA